MTSNKVLDWRDKISELWHQSASIWDQAKSFSFASADQYLAFCAAKDWLQDTTEVLLLHRRQGFSDDSHKAYLEFWGILQTVFVQQDAIAELDYSFSGNRGFRRKDKGAAWTEIRELRNLAVGHPTNKKTPRQSN